MSGKKKSEVRSQKSEISPADGLLANVQRALAHPRGWEFFNLETNGVITGTVIVVRGERNGALVVRAIDERCARPNEEGK